MNSFDLKCYQKTYQDPQYWDNNLSASQSEQKQKWAECRAMTDNFYDELIRRGYLIPQSKNKT